MEHDFGKQIQKTKREYYIQVGGIVDHDRVGEQRGWNFMIFKVPYNQNHPVILWFSEWFLPSLFSMTKTNYFILFQNKP